MPRLQRKSFDTPEQVREFPNGKIRIVSLDETMVGDFRMEPGWRWSRDVKPIVGTDSCQNRHLGYVISGRLQVEMDDGTTIEIRAGDAFEIPPGHDAWVLGDEQWVTVEFTSARVFAVGPEDSGEGVVATLVFTDIVNSTSTLERLGDVAWRDLLLRHNEEMRAQIDRHRGREVNTTGDGFLAMFDGAGRAVRCGLGMAHAARSLGLEIRVGCHTGEVQPVGGDVRGIAVHAAARVMSLGGPGEVVVSSTTRDLLDGTGLELESIGSHELKGLSGPREVFRVNA
jgi:class 3 adenylate cyclase